MAVDDFRWTHFSRGTLQELARASGLRVSHAATDLADRYGEPPAEAFVADVWPTLRDGWFKRTPAAREELVTVLRAARLGRTELSVRTRAGQMEYLRSCRQSDLLRREALRLFLDAGRQPITVPLAASYQAQSASARNDLIEQFRVACAEVALEALPSVELSVAVGIGEVLERVPMPVPSDLRGDVAGTIVGTALSTFAQHHREVTDWRGAPLSHRPLLVEGARRLGESRDACLDLFVDLVEQVAQALASLEDRRLLQLTCTSLCLSRIALGELNDTNQRQQQEFTTSLRWVAAVLARADSDEASAETDAEAPKPDEQSEQRPQSLVEFVDRALREHWDPVGPHRVREDKIGWQIRHGSTTVDVHAVHFPSGPQLVRYQAVLLGDVPRSDDLLLTVNELNRKEHFNKLYWADDTVVMEYDQLAVDLSAVHLAATLVQFLGMADAMDTLLRDRFGGRTHAPDIKATFHV